MVRYKTFDLKHYIVFVKIKPPTGQITFWISPLKAQKKVVVNFIYGNQNLSGEKYKSNGKRISSIRHTSEEKNPKNHPKIAHFRKVVFLDGFFLFTGMSD